MFSAIAKRMALQGGAFKTVLPIRHLSMASANVQQLAMLRIPLSSPSSLIKQSPVSAPAVQKSIFDFIQPQPQQQNNKPTTTGISQIGQIMDRKNGVIEEIKLDSVMRKRRLKMKKHKLRKRRKAQRALRQKLGK